MSSNVDKTKNESTTSKSSPFSHTPKFSPPRSRNASPARRPLHQRSDSETNQYSSPTIRVVEDPGTDIYSKTPFPSQPAQILSPRNAPGYVFEGKGSRVSDQTLVTNAVPKAEPTQTLVPQSLQPKRAIRHSASTSTSDADTIVAASSFSPSSSRFSQGTTPPSSPTADRSSKERGLGILEEAISHPSPRQSTIRAVSPSLSSGGDSHEGHALTPKASAASLASTSSVESETLTHHEHEHKRESSGPQSLPYNRSSSTNSDTKKQASSTYARPSTKPSEESLASSGNWYVTHDRPRSSSQPSRPSSSSHDAQHVTIATGVQVHYPVVRAPSASSLWAESSQSRVTPKNSTPSRMTTRATQAHQWSSQLSTIHSESDPGSHSGRNSHSVEGASVSNEEHSRNGRGHVAGRRQTIASVASSGDVPSSDLTSSSISVPLPLFSPITRPSDRDSDEHHDTISPLQSPPLRTKRSGYLQRLNSDSRSSSSRPSSSQSNSSMRVFTNSLPAWARSYYRRGERSSLGAPDESTEASDSIRIPTAQSGRTNTPSEGNFPLSIYRPRNRPHQRGSHLTEDSMAISDGPVEQDIYVVGPSRRALEPFTPRLRQDRRSQARLSAWKAPSFDDSLGTLFFSRQNRQILLFCLGFIFPPAWIIASILPLPPNPQMQEITPSQLALENHFVQTLGPVDDRSHQKAMWWRNLNRIMSGIGTLLIGVIIALAILASKM